MTGFRIHKIFLKQKSVKEIFWNQKFLWNVTFLNTVIHSLSRREIIIKSMSDNPVQVQFGIGSNKL